MQNVCLRVMEKSDLKMVLSWRNSPRVRNAMYTDRIITLREHDEWFKQCLQKESIRNYVFCLNKLPVGVVNITNIDILNSSCSWSIYIGDTSVPKGTGYLMGRTAIKYIFEELRLDKVIVEVLEKNKVSLKFHEKLGFFVTKVLEDYIFRNGNHENVVCLELYRKQYEEEKLCMKNDMIVF